jgi:multicomponent Na+:H+ antiporter subunit C
MDLLSAILIGALYGAGAHMILRRNVVKLIIGLALLGHGSNLLILTAGGLSRGRSPILEESAATLADTADPLPQALILTAIVISFGVLAFTIVLVHRASEMADVSDTDHPDLREP